MQLTCARTIPILIWTDAIGLHHSSPLIHEDFCSLYFVRSGRGTHVIDENLYSVTRGDVYAMGPGASHYFIDVESMVLDTIHFLPEVFDQHTIDVLTGLPGFHDLLISQPMLRRLAKRDRWLHLSPTGYDEVIGRFNELYLEWSRGTAEGVILTRGLFFRLLVHLSRLNNPIDIVSHSSNAPSESVIADAVHYIDSNFTDPIRVEHIARMVYLSADRFTEVFQEVMGRTPREYITHLRIERAKALLEQQNLPISEIAQDSGFGESAYFSRIFKEKLGTTPREYRFTQRKRS